MESEKEKCKVQNRERHLSSKCSLSTTSCERNTVPSYFLAFDQTEFIVTEDYDIVGAYVLYMRTLWVVM